MIVLGIDPGTAVTGYGVVVSGSRGTHSLVECGVIRTRARDPLAARLAEIFDGVSELLERSHQGELSTSEATELERYMLLEHMVRLAKGHAYRQLAHRQ